MRKVLSLRKEFSFPPKDEDDTRIMKYSEFLEFEICDNPGSPEIFYRALIDPEAIRCCQEFVQFIDDYGEYETVSGNKICDIFKCSQEEETGLLLFFIVNNEQLLIDKEGYVHLGILQQKLERSELRFISTALSDYYGFKVYEEERPRL